jgi:hypothetical protein
MKLTPFKLNDRGAMTLIILVMLSTMFIVMMGVAGYKLIEAAKNAQRQTEAYNFLIAMEELGQAVSRARSLGRELDCRTTYNPADPCPTGTTIAINAAVGSTKCTNDPTPRDHYTLCVPNTDGDNTAESSDFCASVDGKNYCLDGPLWTTGLQRLDLAAENTDHGVPPPLAEPAGAAYEQTPGGALIPRNTMEYWTPEAVWAGGNVNEIYTTDCEAYSAANNDRYWLGCHFCSDPRVECWAMRMCPVPIAASTCNPATQRVTQRFVLYFENNRR